MDDSSSLDWTGGFILGAIIGAAFVIAIMLAADPFIRGYKSGQIDALTGNIKYHLVTNADSTKTWQRRP